jgi:hypothetical protein
MHEGESGPLTETGGLMIIDPVIQGAFIQEDWIR